MHLIPTHFIGTFKLKKNRLQDEAYNPSRCGDDPLYFLHPKEDRYLPMSEDLLDAINTGQLRL